MSARFEVERYTRQINEFIGRCGFTPRDADGSDFASEQWPHTRIKTGCVLGEVTVTFWVDDKPSPDDTIRILNHHQATEAEEQIIRVIWRVNPAEYHKLYEGK